MQAQCWLALLFSISNTIARELSLAGRKRKTISIEETTGFGSVVSWSRLTPLSRLFRSNSLSLIDTLV